MTVAKEVDVVAICSTLSIKNKQPMASSLDVAEGFGKRHDNVIQTIESLECSKEFTRLNFQVSKYKDKSGKLNKSYQMTKDGFVFLTMGFSGKRASEFKEAYINAFNHMQNKLIEQQQKDIGEQYRLRGVPQDEAITDFVTSEVKSVNQALSGISNFLDMIAYTGLYRNARINNFKAVNNQLKMVIKQINLIIKLEFDGDLNSYINITEN